MEIEASFIQDIRQMLRQARQQAYSAVNAAMVEAYWHIGKRIVEEEQKGQQRAEYGEGLIKELSLQLTGEFGKGFSAPNLRNFRQFYLVFPDAENRYTLCSKLTWSHCRLAMRVENPQAREYYLREAADQQWSVRQLERNIHTFYYERLLTSPDKRAALVAQAEMEKESPRDFIKDPYVFEFLNIPEPYRASEKEIESALIENLQAFLLELGKGFSFIGRQQRITIGDRHFYVDLVFYHIILRCYVLIDLKVGEVQHEDVGQMNMYVNYFKTERKNEGDADPIGIILCADKREVIIEYALGGITNQLFVSKYQLYFPDKEQIGRASCRERVSSPV